MEEECIINIYLDEAKLKSNKLNEKDLFLFLRVIYSKAEMSISDRNFIKKVLLTLFSEELILCLGKNLTSYTKYL